MNKQDKIKVLEIIISKIKSSNRGEGFICNEFDFIIKSIDSVDKIKLPFNVEIMLIEFPELHNTVMLVGQEQYYKLGITDEFIFGNAWLLTGRNFQSYENDVKQFKVEKLKKLLNQLK